MAVAGLEGLVMGTVWFSSGPVAAEIVGVKNFGSVLVIYSVFLFMPALLASPNTLELLKQWVLSTAILLLKLKTCSALGRRLGGLN